MDHPRDLLALKFAHDNYFFLGLGPQMRDSIARVWSKWNKSVPLYGYVVFWLVWFMLYISANRRDVAPILLTTVTPDDVYYEFDQSNTARILYLFFFNRYLYGMYSFGLEETNLYPKAEEIARKVGIFKVKVISTFTKIEIQISSFQ